MTDDDAPRTLGRDAAILATSRVSAVWSPGEAALDPQLRAAGEDHLARTLERWPAFYDGAVGCLAALSPEGMTLSVGSFFDVLRSDGAALDPGAREVLTALADGDPLRSGRGRAAALGVSLLLVRGTGPRRRVLAGMRSAEVVNPGVWHTVPAGTVDAGTARSGEEPIRATAALEAREELGLEVAAQDMVALGWAWDLPTLRPEAVLLCDATDLDVGDHCGEHDRLEWLPLTTPPADASPILHAALALAADAG